MMRTTRTLACLVMASALFSGSALCSRVLLRSDEAGSVGFVFEEAFQTECGATGCSPIHEAVAHGSSHVTGTGAHAEATSGNGAIAYKNTLSGTDLSLVNTAGWGYGGLNGEATGQASTLAFTGRSKADGAPDTSKSGSNAYTMTDIHHSVPHFSPTGRANSHFSASGYALGLDTRPVQQSGGADISIVTPHFSGASAHSSGGVGKSLVALEGSLDHIRWYGGGALPPTAVDVSRFHP